MAWTWCLFAGSSDRKSLCVANIVSKAINHPGVLNRGRTYFDYRYQESECFPAPRDRLNDHILVPTEDVET
jgi:hypothetical protein